MNRFWKPIIQPLISILQPTKIAEIGAASSTNTRNLLGFCREHGAVLYIIDPAPQADVEAMLEEDKEILRYYRDSSINILPKIDAMDAVLIDGDHNWYTVINELRLIETVSKARSADFPVVFLHDIGWPYGRRDQYNNPDNIPKSFLKPHQQSGLHPDHSKPLKQGGLNAHLCHAIDENGKQNGVLTAIEDFLKETREDLDLIKLPVLYGLGILFPRKLRKSNAEFSGYVRRLKFSPALILMLEEFERDRILSAINIQDLRMGGTHTKDEITRLQKELKKVRKKLSDESSRIAENDLTLKKLEKSLNTKKRKSMDLQKQVSELKKTISESALAQEDLVASLNKQEQKLAAALQTNAKLERKIVRAEKNLNLARSKNEKLGKALESAEEGKALADRKNKQYKKSVEELRKNLRSRIRQIENLHRTTQEKDNRLAFDSNELTQRGNDILQLVSWYQNLSRITDALIGSRRWNLGDILGKTFNRVLFRKLEVPALEEKSDLDNVFRTWLSDHRFNRYEEGISQYPGMRSSRGFDHRYSDDQEEWTSPPFTRRLRKRSSRTIRAEKKRRFLQRSPQVDIVVCVHNAIEYVEKCLASIVEKTSNRYHLILVNDGSGETTSKYLKYFSASHPSCELIENKRARGYTIAANQGLQVANNDFIVLLNSDTIVTRNWLKLLLECAFSDSSIGIVGPLSNAASWQSVPLQKDANGDWAVNELPPDVSIDEMASIVLRLSSKRFPSVPFVNGFCLLIRREVINAIGYLDEKNFPQGYGEENDYCLRALEAGFSAAIADHAYIYHSKSKSFGHKTRQKYSREGWEALKQKHGISYLKKQLDFISQEPTLKAVGKRIADYLSKYIVPSGSESASESKNLFVNYTTEPHKISMPQHQWQFNAEFQNYLKYESAKRQTRKKDNEKRFSTRVIMLPGDKNNLMRSLDSLGKPQRIFNTQITCLNTSEDDSLDGNSKGNIQYSLLTINDRNNPIEEINRLIGQIDEDFFLLLPAGACLAENALPDLFHNLEYYIGTRPDPDAIICDDDEIDDNGRRKNPGLKFGFSPEYLLEFDYVRYSVWFRRRAAAAVGGFDARFPNSFVRALILKLFDDEKSIAKADIFCIHYPLGFKSVTPRNEQELLLRVVAERRAWPLTEIQHHPYGPHPLYEVGNTPVSILITFRDKVDFLKKLITSIFKKSTYSNFELILLNNASSESATANYLNSLSDNDKISIYDYDFPFNFSKINNFGSLRSNGEVLIFLNNDTEILSPDWIEQLAGDARLPGIGAVGSKLYYPDGRLQHFGVEIGLSGLAGHPFAGEDEAKIPQELIVFRRNWTAVTAACMAIKKSVFEQIGRFDEQFQITGSDVELCLRLLDKGFRNVVNPDVKLLHHEKASRINIPIRNIDIELSTIHYQPYLDIGDPFHHTALSQNVNTLKWKLDEVPIHQSFMKDYREKQLRQRRKITRPGRFFTQKKKLTDNEVLRYDIHRTELQRNKELMERFYRNPSLNPQRLLWFIPEFTHIFRGGIYTIFRFAEYFSKRAGTLNEIVIYSHRTNQNTSKYKEMISKAFPHLNHNIWAFNYNHDDVNELPKVDAAFCTLWNSAYLLAKFNKTKGKFYFNQDHETIFYPAGSVFGLIEQTYNMGFIGVCNTPGVASQYYRYNDWVTYFIPGVDTEIFFPGDAAKRKADPIQIVFYGRPDNSRNAFRLGIESFRKLKKQYGKHVQIISVGAKFALSDYKLKNIMKNLGVLPNLEAVAKLYRSCDIGLTFMFTPHPSYQPFEYMASGCVPVTNWNMHNLWLFENDYNVALTEPVVSRITERLAELVEDKDLRERIVAGGLETVAKLNWEDELEKVYQFVCQPKQISREELDIDKFKNRNLEIPLRDIG